MKKEISLNGFIDEFRNSNHDNFSHEGYEALYDYYSEFEDFDLDVIGIDCEMAEYDGDELISEFKYLLNFEEFKEENKDWIDDEDEMQEEYINELIKTMERQTTTMALSNGCFIVRSF